MADSTGDVARLLHNLNNDLGVVIGHVELALRKADDLPPELVRRLEAIRGAAERMTDRIKAAQSASGDRKPG
jgi:signal transduction histidine kinase